MPKKRHLPDRPSGNSPRNVRFGPCEQKLFDYLLAAFRSQRWARPREEVFAHVYDVRDPEQAAAGEFNRLRQLIFAVNRKLRRAGDRREIQSPYYKSLALIVTDISNRPEHPGRDEKTASTARRPARPRGLSVRECAALLREELAKGNNRASYLERLCTKEHRGSRRAYFAARRLLGLRSVLCRDGGRWHRVLVPQAPTQQGDEGVPSTWPGRASNRLKL
jgi:hypothetical protein